MIAIQSRRRLHTALICTIAVGLSGACASAQDGRQVQVLVYNDARVQKSTLRAGELETARIFRLAGVRIAWVNCSSDLPARDKEHCRFGPRTNEYVLRLIPEGKNSTDLVFGEAFLDEAGSGRYADVFFDRIRAAHDEHGTNVTRLLGAVTAHELGHLFLGFRAHSWIGIMTPLWEGQCLRRMAMGNLLFTREQATRMQFTLGENQTHDSLSIAQK